MNHKTKIFKLSIISLLIASSFSTFAGKIEVIEVTANKHAQKLTEVGMTINAFTGDDLKEMGVKTAEDLAGQTPGLTVTESAATGIPNYAIRGIGLQDYSTSSSSTVGLYFDEVAMPYPVMTRGVVFDVERVEVLKGPQGDLYGRNTTAGQINFISNTPTEDFLLDITAGYNNLNQASLEFVANGELSDRINGRFAMRTIQSNEGWKESLTRDDTLGKKDELAMRAMFDIELNSDAKLLLKAHYVKDKSDNLAPTAYNGEIRGFDEYNNPYIGGLEEYIKPDGQYYGQTPPWYSDDDARKADWSNSYTSPLTGQTWDLRPAKDNELKGLLVRLNWEFEQFNFTSLTAVDQFNRQESNDWDGTAAVVTGNINTTDITSVSQELRLDGVYNDMLWIVGAYFSSDEMEEEYHYFMADSAFGLAAVEYERAPFSLAPILELDTSYQQQTKSAAIFGHLEYKLTSKLKLTSGIRYTQETRDWQGCSNDADGSLTAFSNLLFGATLQQGDCSVIDDIPESETNIFKVLGTENVNDAFHKIEDSINTNRWMGKLGVDYQFTPDTLGYFTASYGFKSGGFNGANANTATQLIPYKPETLMAYEFGLKSMLLDNSLQINASTFYYDYKDKQEADTAVTFVGNVGGFTNVPKSEVAGVELELNWFPVDNLSIRMGAAYLHTEVKEWDAVDGDKSQWPNIVTRDLSGIELAASPKWSSNGVIRYDWEVADGYMMDIAADYVYKAEAMGGPREAKNTEAYTLFNARLGFGNDSGDWRFTLWARNLTDEYYYPAAFGTDGPYVRSPGMPRTFGIDFRYNYY